MKKKAEPTFPIKYISARIKNKYRGRTITRDAVGMSPAEVYKIDGGDDALYLKRSARKYCDTTYDVRREYDIINWLAGKLKLPKVIYYEETKKYNTLIMSGMKGVELEELKGNISIHEYIDYYVRSLKLIRSIDIKDCPYDNRVSFRLNELSYLIENGLADINVDNWEDDTEFDDGTELYNYLKANKPEEDPVLSHGDLCNSNIFIDEGEIGFIDLGRCGIADKWMDIAFCVREIRELNNDPKWIDLFFDKIGVEPDWNKIKYFILLDELF